MHEQWHQHQDRYRQQQHFDQQPPPAHLQQHFQQQQQQQRPGGPPGMPPPHMLPPQQQQQQQHFLSPHMAPPSMQQQEQQQRRKFAPNELSPAAAATFEGCLPPDMLPLDWRQMNSWFSLDARVKFTVNGMEPATCRNHAVLCNAEAASNSIHSSRAAEPGRAAAWAVAATPARPRHAFCCHANSPANFCVCHRSGWQPATSQQQQQAPWQGQAGHPAAGQGYSHEQQHGAGVDAGQDDDDLDEMLGLLNVNS
ncbi:hypothetical protein COO60DRAFT_1038153 [Scenedesmus sp. NREL 46B-D3]|nr:hypothetical protein COO60DRAFT_1038153 [Scenedesmus sp. NREL 46B-D3]